jgi:hypothetical protein
MIKQLMIPVAAFAVTVTGVSAFNTDMLEKIDVDLSSTQISALEEVHELKASGAERDEIKAILEAADIDKDTMKEIRTATHELQQEGREVVKVAVAAGDYDAFVAAAPDRLLEAVDSESDFETFANAIELKEAGDNEGAQALMAELGIEKPDHAEKGEKEGRGGEREGKGPRGGERTEA